MKAGEILENIFGDFYQSKNDVARAKTNIYQASHFSSPDVIKILVTRKCLDTIKTYNIRKLSRLKFTIFQLDCIFLAEKVFVLDLWELSDSFSSGHTPSISR